MIFTNDDDVQSWQQLSKITRDGVSTMGLIAAETCYNEGEPFLDEELDVLRTNRDIATQELTKLGVKAAVPQSTYLLWLDFSDTPIAEAPSLILREQAHVMLNDGSDFGGFTDCARLNFACSPDTLDEALRRIATVL